MIMEVNRAINFQIVLWCWLAVGMMIYTYSACPSTDWHFTFYKKSYLGKDSTPPIPPPVWFSRQIKRRKLLWSAYCLILSLNWICL